VRRGALRAFDNAVTRWLLVVAADAVGLTLIGFLSSATCSVKTRVQLIYVLCLDAAISDAQLSDAQRSLPLA
jgi:hypothetical protein